MIKSRRFELSKAVNYATSVGKKFIGLLFQNTFSQENICKYSTKYNIIGKNLCVNFEKKVSASY